MVSAAFDGVSSWEKGAPPQRTRRTLSGAEDAGATWLVARASRLGLNGYESRLRWAGASGLWYLVWVKRMARMARRVLVGGSLVLCLATIWLWAMGCRGGAYWVAGYRAHWSGPLHVDRASVQIYSERGRLLMLAGRYDEGIYGAPAKIVEESHRGALEGRYFYIGPRLMAPASSRRDTWQLPSAADQ